MGDGETIKVGEVDDGDGDIDGEDDGVGDEGTSAAAGAGAGDDDVGEDDGDGAEDGDGDKAGEGDELTFGFVGATDAGKLLTAAATSPRGRAAATRNPAMTRSAPHTSSPPPTT